MAGWLVGWLAGWNEEIFNASLIPFVQPRDVQANKGKTNQEKKEKADSASRASSCLIGGGYITTSGFGRCFLVDFMECPMEVFGKG